MSHRLGSPLHGVSNQDKQSLRRSLRARLRQVPPPQRAAWSAQACAALGATERCNRAGTLFCFVSLPWEIDTGPLLRATLQRGGRLAVPRIQAPGRIEALAIDDLGALRPGPMGILEPIAGTPVPPEEIDLLVCPGLAFDPSGGRLGQGGGFYDRFLAGVRPGDVWVVGLAFDLQRLPRVPTEPHDLPVAAVATESGVHDRS